MSKTTLLTYGNMQISTPVKFRPRHQLAWNLAPVIMSATSQNVPSFVAIRWVGFAQHISLIRAFRTFLNSFFVHYVQRSNRSTEFYTWWLRRRGLKCFLRAVRTKSFFWRSILLPLKFPLICLEIWKRINNFQHILRKDQWTTNRHSWNCANGDQQEYNVDKK